MSDLSFTNHGTVAMCVVHTPAAEAWVAEHVPTEPWQWMGTAFAVEPRYVQNLIDGATADGLECET